MKRPSLVIFFGLLFIPDIMLGCPSSISLRGGGVGHGGDTLNRHLATTRYALIETLKEISKLPDTRSLCRCQESHSIDPACDFLKTLNSEQTAYCQRFIVEKQQEILDLNEKDPLTEFHISAEPLFVEGPDGNLRQVVAKTPMGAKGRITFHYEGTTGLSSINLLALMSHEFGHKVPFGGKNEFIDDNFPVGPFKMSEGGRMFLDAVGSAIAHHAVKFGLVGVYNGFEDRFVCSIHNIKNQNAFISAGHSPRLYNGFLVNKYKTGIGNVPSDFHCMIKEAKSDSCLDFRLEVIEGGNCGNPEVKRCTQLELWRTYPYQPGEKQKVPERLILKEFLSWSPIIKTLQKIPMKIEYEENGQAYVFEAKYEGLTNKIR